MPPVPPSLPMSGVPCQICGQGIMTRKRVFRMSTPVVVIGFVLLVPSILGILFGGLMFAAAMVGSSETKASDLEISMARMRLITNGVPNDIIEDVAVEKQIGELRLSRLTLAQRSAVREAELKIKSSKLGSGAATACGVGFSFMMIIGAFVGGLLGWLLIMRKSVLQCSRCGAVVAAS